MTLRETLVSVPPFCAVPASAFTPQETWNVVLTPVVRGLQDHAGLDGETTLLNRRNAIDLNENPNDRETFCK